MSDLLINLLASVIAGVAVWLGQRAVRYRRLARTRAFFGLADGARALLAVGRHHSSPNERSVNRRDVATVVELATLVRECGARADLSSESDVSPEIGRVTEFSVGGPLGNRRATTHLRSLLPGISYGPPEHTGDTFSVGGVTYEHTKGTVEYAVLARTRAPAGGKPIFLLGGQSSRGNLAAARHLAREHPALARSHGSDRPFCLILKLVEPEVYGTDFVEVVADVSGVAFGP